jgi:leader peptidase (prepilin peptidase)/N-methyltransferase
LLATAAVLQVGLVALMGVALGSFLGAMASRWPTLDRRFLLGRSRCPACGTALDAAETIPVWAWLRQAGRCRRCGAAIGWEPLLAELLGGLIALVAVLSLPPLTALVFAGVALWLLLLALIDIEHGRLPDSLTLPLACLGIGAALAAPIPSVVPPIDSLAGAVLGFGLLFATARIYAAWRGREGLGLGDAKLLGALGAWLGVNDLALVILGSALAALVFALVTGRRQATDSLAFGPWLALAGGGLLWWRLLEAT